VVLTFTSSGSFEISAVVASGIREDQRICVGLRRVSIQCMCESKYSLSTLICFFKS